jgi:hypothetical protein
MGYNMNMGIKNSKYIILVMIFLIFVSCQARNNIVPERILSDIEYNEWYDRMQEKELENYLSNNNDLINLGWISVNTFIEKHGEKNILYYRYYSEWNDDVRGINYEHYKELFLVKMNENEYYVLINQCLIPFSEEITLHTIARINNDKFVFKTQDAWDNAIVGNFYFDGNNIVLETECERSFNPLGKIFSGRQYGGVYVLEKRNR